MTERKNPHFDATGSTVLHNDIEALYEIQKAIGTGDWISTALEDTSGEDPNAVESLPEWWHARVDHVERILNDHYGEVNRTEWDDGGMVTFTARNLKLSFTPTYTQVVVEHNSWEFHGYLDDFNAVEAAITSMFNRIALESRAPHEIDELVRFSRTATPPLNCSITELVDYYGVQYNELSRGPIHGKSGMELWQGLRDRHYETIREHVRTVEEAKATADPHSESPFEVSRIISTIAGTLLNIRLEIDTGYTMSVSDGETDYTHTLRKEDDESLYVYLTAPTDHVELTSNGVVESVNENLGQLISITADGLVSHRDIDKTIDPNDLIFTEADSDKSGISTPDSHTLIVAKVPDNLYPEELPDDGLVD
jgi:hypothetical protein